MKSDFIDRSTGKFYHDTTRQSIVIANMPFVERRNLVARSKWYTYEHFDYTAAMTIDKHPCLVCGKPVECTKQDSDKAYCGCKGRNSWEPMKTEVARRIGRK